MFIYFGCTLSFMSTIIAKITPTGRIVGGSTALKNFFPFIAFLKGYLLVNGSWEDHICAGSILSNIYILTAAHCTVK